MNGDSINCSTRIGERIEIMQNLMEEVLTLQRDGEKGEGTMERVRQIVDESGRIVEQSDEAHEMVFDANILATSSHLVRSYVHAFDTNLNSFSSEEYTSGILAYLEKNCLRGSHDWDILANETCGFFKKVPSLSYMLGTFELDPPPPPEKAERQKKSVEAKKSCVIAVEQSGQDAEPTDEVYKHIMKCLVDYYRKNGKKPVNMLQFVVDPSCYWRTVENIFHFSFLVRDEMVHISINEQGIPLAQPVFKKEKGEGHAKRKNSQFLFRLTQYEWKDIINTFSIRRPSITPLV